jgi:hypothetical protein
MEFSFFINNNKSGHKTRESWFSKNHPIIYNEIIDYSKSMNLEGASFKEKIWFFFNKLTERPKCLTCSSEIKFRERFDVPYGDFCSLFCINKNKEEMNKRIKKSMNDKYGVNFYPQHKEFVTKQSKTKKERYGDENYNNIEKIKKTKHKKYGTPNYNNVEKIKITSLKKYGVDNVSKNEEIKTKIKLTNNQKYGFNSPSQNPQIKELKRKKILEKLKENVGDGFISYSFHTSTYKIFCSDCKNEYVIPAGLYNERKRNGNGVCLNCFPVGETSSFLEKDLMGFVESIYDHLEIGNKTILEGKELDIHIPRKDLSIEFDGLYWHSELFKDDNYRLQKTINYSEKGFNLIHIFEDEWLYRKEIVKSIIKNRLGLIDDKIFARNCEIKDVTPKESEEFLNNNHIQGKIRSKVKIGLYHKGNLVSLMTFSRGRIIMGGKKTEWELTRFCNKINTNVIGGASKLLKYFVKNYNPNLIVSYSDIRLFNGGLYEKLGFNFKSQSKPNYWYIIGDKRFHRFNFRKSILVKEGFDPNKTEKEIMLDRKIYRIYDCGNIRWEYHPNH